MEYEETKLRETYGQNYNFKFIFAKDLFSKFIHIAAINIKKYFLKYLSQKLS